MCALPQIDGIFRLTKMKLMAHRGYVSKSYIEYLRKKIRTCGSPSCAATQKMRVIK